VTGRIVILGWFESALKNRIRQFVIDGETAVLGVDGISDFKALHSGEHNEEVQPYTFDVLAIGGDDLRRLPLSMRKANLARLLARRPAGIFRAPLSKVRSDQTVSARLAGLDSRAWFRSIATGLTRAARRSTGSRSRTESITLSPQLRNHLSR
jgi:ATP-dependent DNA ligase